MSPKVSIIMPVLNGQKYIGEAIESIAAQTYKDFELIVVNDGSTDTTCERLQNFAGRIDLRRIDHATPHGIARSVNDGIRQARGQFIAFLDHDDLWFPNFLETQMAHLQQYPDVGMVHSDFQTVDSAGNIIEASVALCRNRKRESGYVFRQLFMDSFIVGNSVLIRKECFDKLGGFNESIRIGDYEMWMRIARHYKVDYTPQVLTKYRQHQTQDSRTFAAEQEPPSLESIKSILELYPDARKELGEATIRRRMATLYCDVAHSSFAAGAGRNARIFVTKAIRLQRMNWRLYALYAASLLPPSQAIVARRLWQGLQRAGLPFRTSHAG